MLDQKVNGLADSLQAGDDAIVQFFQSELSDDLADDLLVRSTAMAMSRKLEKCRVEKGRGGWHTDRACNSDLEQGVYGHFEKPLDAENITDLINLLAMMRMRLMVYGEKA